MGTVFGTSESQGLPPTKPDFAVDTSFGGRKNFQLENCHVSSKSFFGRNKQYLGLHHFKIDFRDVCALLDFASLEKLFSNPISLIQELEICELKCPEPW